MRKKLKFLCFIAASLFLFFSYFEYARYENEVKNEVLAKAVSDTVLSSTGDLVDVYLELKSQNFNRSVTSKLQDDIRKQTLLVVDTGFDVRELKQNAFRGICLLVGNRENLFPQSELSNANAVIDGLLNKQLSSISQDLRTEKELRDRRLPGYSQSCPGF